MKFVIQGCVVVQESLCRVFDPMPVHMGYVNYKVAQKQVSVRVLPWSGSRSGLFPFKEEVPLPIPCAPSIDTDDVENRIS